MSQKTLLPHPEKGALTYKGKPYSTHDSASARRKVLEGKVKEIGYASTMRDVNLIATLTKNQAPEASKKMRADMQYLRKEYRPEAYKEHKSRESKKGGSKKSHKSHKSKKSRKSSRSKKSHKSHKSKKSHKSRK